MKKFGFTLAEILIVLGIIGVVSTLTLPNVMADHKKKTFTTQLQRFYNQVNNAVSKYKYENEIDDLSESDLNTIEGVKSFVQKNFKVTKNCGSVTVGEDAATGEHSQATCFASAYTSIDKTVTSPEAIANITTENRYCAVLDTGASICLSKLGGQYPTGVSGEVVEAIQIALDLNGLAGPNMAGRDYFTFHLFSDGVIAGNYNLDTRKTECKPTASPTSFDASSCFDTIIGNNWVMNY